MRLEYIPVDYTVHLFIYNFVVKQQISNALVISTVNHGPPVGLYAETLVAE